MRLDDNIVRPYKNLLKEAARSGVTDNELTWMRVKAEKDIHACIENSGNLELYEEAVRVGGQGADLALVKALITKNLVSYAVLDGDIELLNCLIDRTGMVPQEDDLQLAIRCGHTDIVNYLISDTGLGDGCNTDEEGGTS